MTDKEKQLVSMSETYNVLAKAMAKEINADRTDALVFALEKQNELLYDLMDGEDE